MRKSDGVQVFRVRTPCVIGDMVSNLSALMFSKTEYADCNDTLYSVEHPPKITAIFVFFFSIVNSSFKKNETPVQVLILYQKQEFLLFVSVYGIPLIFCGNSYDFPTRGELLP